MSDDTNPRVHFYRSLHEARLLDARAAIQVGLYINGLAATAMLAFLGSVSPKFGEAHGAHATHAPRAFVWSLGGFAFGVLCAALAATFSYVANHAYAEAESPAVKADEVRWNDRRSATTAHKCAYWACGLMLLAFAFGVGAAIIGFDKL